VEKRRGSGGSFDVALSAVEGDCGPKHARTVAANTATGGTETTITTFSFAAGGTSTPTRRKQTLDGNPGGCGPKHARTVAAFPDFSATSAGGGACAPKFSGGCGPSY